MAYDPIRRAQLLLRRAGHRLQRPSPQAACPEGRDEAARERYFDGGSKQIAGLAARIEAHTGCALESRRALDFGCGVGRMALPLAERCEHVYGVDVSPAVLRAADSNARRMKLSNVEWLEAGRLAELSGRYDLVISHWVFQHIPSREGERIFSTLVRGLGPGGVGAIHVILRPSDPLAGILRWMRRLVRGAYHPLRLIRDTDWAYPYMLMNSYSLNRLGRLLADGGVSEWHVKWHPMPVSGWQAYDHVTIIFRKDDVELVAEQPSRRLVAAKFSA
jgi:2-polyprenyl-3-methyl-5-hydroxy-6-metoxy-1,4-benzoquinol methylase